ncbi:hypothetical protein JCM9279_006319 [Rhodotorula babjevae]
MGLEHFQEVCPSVSSLQDAQVWCVAKVGTCCGVCPNTLASLGTRVGLTVTVFFATLVVVVDGAEAPFIFMTTCLQALAYLVTVLQAGLTGDGISRFHAYYALVCSMGFLSPLAAASVTAPHFHYGGAHQTGSRLLAFRTDLSTRRARADPTDPPARQSRSYRSLGSPFFHSASRRPLRSTDPFRHYEGTSTEASPIVRPVDPDVALEPRQRGRRTESRLDEEAALESPKLLPATPSSLLSRHSPILGSPAGSATRLAHPKRQPRRSLDEPDPTLTALPPLELAPAALPPPAALRRRLKKRQPPERPPRTRSSSSDYAPEQLRKIEKKTQDGRWRRWGMIVANALLFLLWLAVFLLVHGDVGGFTFIQTTCTDPSSTELLTTASIALLCFSVLIFAVCALNFYSHVLHFHVRRILDYSRGPGFWSQLAVPAVFSSIVFSLWLALLWTSYELAAQPSSSLLAESEQSTTFATILSIALVVKPVSDLVKALFKLHRRKSRLAKSKLRQRASLPDPPPSPASSSRPPSTHDNDPDDDDADERCQRGRQRRSRATLGPRDEQQRLVESRRSPAARSSQSSSGDFSRTSSQAARLESPSSRSTSEDAAEEASRRRRKRVSLQAGSSGPALERAG